MIELSGMFEEELVLLLNWLAGNKRHVAFEGAQVVSEGGLGQIRHPLGEGPMVHGRRIATVGAPYVVPSLDLGNDCCPHHALGQIETGAEDIVYKGVPVVMVGDSGRHWPGCGTSQVFVSEGWLQVPVPASAWNFDTLDGPRGLTFTADTDPDSVMYAMMSMGLRLTDKTDP